jgi:hypothetical protein
LWLTVVRRECNASGRRSRKVRVSPGRVHFRNAACCASMAAPAARNAIMSPNVHFRHALQCCTTRWPDEPIVPLHEQMNVHERCAWHGTGSGAGVHSVDVLSLLTYQFNGYLWRIKICDDKDRIEFIEID